jgi:ABC-type multidrug transport system ATPase subunit
MIRLERFEKRYGRIRAVKPLDLEVAAGESFALLGPNGSGKTTIIRALAGLHFPSAGRILVDGLDVARSPDAVKARLSYVPQRVSMPEMLTARELAALFARLKGVSPRRVDQVLEQFALLEQADRRVGEYSGGMVQRLGLAVAFLKDVPLFVLDEPTVNLDPLGIRTLHRALEQLKSKGTTVLFSSHVLHSTTQLADQVAVLAHGELARLEQVSVFERAVTRQTMVRVILRRATDAMIDAARQAGAEVSSRNGKQLCFRALPERRLEVIRAIEQAGGTIEEFHTEAPAWDALIGSHFGAGEESA